MKIQLVRPEQKISKEPLSNFKEVRLVTMTKDAGVRVDYFDGEIEWFPVNKLVYALKQPRLQISGRVLSKGD